jgi:hypothetical protein
MTRQTRIRLFSLLVLLGVLAGVLATPAEQSNAYAAPCCSSCDYQYDSCVSGGGIYPSCNGDPACCEKIVMQNCWRWCIYSC